jgi:predicted transcriptional regulator
MKLHDFLEETGMPLSKFAHRSGVTYAKLRHIKLGKMPTLETALLIEKQTGGKVTPKDLYEETKENSRTKYY